MKKIGLLFGMENTFPPAVVEKINSMKVEGVSAEFVTIGGIRMDEPKKYDVIIDRISQDIQFYRAYLRTQHCMGRLSSTIRSGGLPMTSFSIMPWRTNWVWPFRRP